MTNYLTLAYMERKKKKTKKNTNNNKNKTKKKKKKKYENNLCLLHNKIVIIVYSAKFEASSSYGSWEISDEKLNISLLGEKEKYNYRRTNKLRMHIVSHMIKLSLLKFCQVWGF